MKITYAENPLFTTIELDDHEKEVLRLKIKVNELEERISSADIYLDPGNAHWVMKETKRHQPHTLETLIEQVRKDYLDIDYIWAEADAERSLDKRVDVLLEHYLDELMSCHGGDCTCVACSCGKCHAEGLLGINTIEGLGKCCASKVNSAFGKDNERTINEVLESLLNYNPVASAAWDKAGASAHAWLLNYRDTHFKDQ